MAQAGQRTLIIDADLRWPKQSKLFNLPNELGLSAALVGDRPVLESIQSTDLENLQVLTSGTKPPNPAEMLNSAAFEEILAELGAHYDRILVDSPPVLPIADARIIATKCDMTILVLRVDRTTRKRAQAGFDSIQSVGATVLGSVLNDVPLAIGYGYGGYYRGRYGYGYGYGGYGYYDGSGDRGGRRKRRGRHTEALNGPDLQPPEPGEEAAAPFDYEVDETSRDPERTAGKIRTRVIEDMSKQANRNDGPSSGTEKKTGNGPAGSAPGPDESRKARERRKRKG
jgi:capsular exopolysaccharide synthesis family protein